MFVLERIESDPEYDQLKAELYELGDYVSMRYNGFVQLSMLACRRAVKNELTLPCIWIGTVQARSWLCIRLERVLETICLASRARSRHRMR